MPRPWYGSNKTRSDVRSNGRKTWCEEIASAGIDLPSTNHLSCKTFNLEVGRYLKSNSSTYVGRYSYLSLKGPATQSVELFHLSVVPT